MTKDQQILLIWCAGALVVLVVAGVLLSGGAGSLETVRSEADQLHGTYTELYPDEGRPSQEALTAARRIGEHQADERKRAESTLVAALPDDYRRTDVNQAGSRLSADLAALKQRAQRQKIALPASLPFEGGFDPDETKRSLQLAQLHLYRSVADLVMDSGITRILTIKEGTPYRDASGTFAVIPCEFTVEGSYDAIVSLLDGMRARHESGFGIRDLKLTQAAQNVGATFLATVIVVNEPAWQLAAVSSTAPTGRGSPSRPAVTPQPASGGGETPVPEGGRRSSRLGGG